MNVDTTQGVIRGAAIATVGPAKGHNFALDATTLQQLADLINASPDGVKSRFKHPNLESGVPGDALGTQVGYIATPVVIDGDTLRGDLVIESYAEKVPGLGDVKAYLLDLADKRPQDMGLSAVFLWQPRGDSPAGQLCVADALRVDAVDIVDEPAANPNGLLSVRPDATARVTTTQAKPKQAAAVVVSALSAQAGVSPVPTSKGDVQMDPAIKQRLVAEYGLSPNASDADAQSFFAMLSPEEQAELQKPAQAAASIPPVTTNTTSNDPSTATPMRAGPVDAEAALLATEQKRVASLRSLGKTLGVTDDVIAEQIVADASVADARKAFLAALSAKNKPLNIVVGDDVKVTSLRGDIGNAILLRAGSSGVKDASDQAKGLANRTLLDMGRTYLSALGVKNLDHMGNTTVAAILMNPVEAQRHVPRLAMLAQSIGDFSSLLADTINKSLQIGYVEANKTWNIWASRNTYPDFKTITRVDFSDVPGLTARAQGAPITFVTLKDNKETYALQEYTNGIKLTRQAIINDDLGGFTKLPQAQAFAAARLEDDVAYAILTGNPTMTDGIALINASHNNTVTGAAPTLAQFAAMEAAMFKQTGLNGARLELTGKYIIVPAEYRTVAMQLVSSPVDPAKSNATPNLYQGYTVVPSARLSASSATYYYMLADQAQFPTIEVSFLQGEETPVLKQQVDFTTDDLNFAIRHTVAAKALNYRGIVRSS